MAQKKKKQTTKNSIYFLIALLVFILSSGKIDFLQYFSNEETTKIEQKIPEKQLENLKQLPAFDGETFVIEINKNQPGFTKEELSLKKGNWQTFSNLDTLNRVGPANAMLHKELMPTEKRGDISKVYPSGWKQKKLANGVMLYNRSHLIAYRFTGENANLKNLFTGTQEMNQKVMTVYEEQIANYLKTTNHHVRLRVTPYFEGEELVARGVQIEAKSVEDKKLSINVFLYNAQSGYEINYLTGAAKKVGK